ICSNRPSTAHARATSNELGDIGKLYQSDFTGDDEIRATDIEVITTAASKIFELPACFVLAEIELEAFALKLVEQVFVQISCLLRKQNVTSLRHRKRDRCRDEIAILQRQAFVVERVGQLCARFDIDDHGRATLDERDACPARV